MPDPAVVPADLSAARFLEELGRRRSADRSQGHDGLRMRDVFDVAKAFTDMPLAEVEKLLEHRRTRRASAP